MEQKRVDPLVADRDGGIQRRFAHRSPNADEQHAINLIRFHARNFAIALDACTGGSREASLALTKLEEAAMWANKAIAHNGVSEQFSVYLANGGKGLDEDIMRGRP